MAFPGRAIRQGDQGEIVARVQRALAARGIRLATDGDFGPRTAEAVALFQTRVALEPDRVVGPLTWAVLFDEEAYQSLAPLSLLFANALVVAKGEVGQGETAPNIGPRIGLYQASVGIRPGSKYCAAFVYFSVDVAAARMGVPNPLPRTGSVHEMWEQAPDWARIPAAAAWDDIRLVRSGAIFLIDHGKGRGHMGFVGLVRVTGTLGTIEGNTNPRRVRDGEGVHDLSRRLREVTLGLLDFQTPPFGA